VRRDAPRDGGYVVGVTGGIASGKSTFARILARAAPSVLVDADRLGHEVLVRPEIAQALARAFGDDVLDPAGRVLRPVLGPRAFASRERLAALDAIVAPPLTALVAKTIDDAARDESRLVVLDAALLVEWDKGAWCDRVVAVTCDRDVRVARLVARTGLPRTEAARRVDLQLPDAARAAYADEVLVNEGTLAEFEREAEARARGVFERARAALADRGRVL
jgi:dephospho-CoA kinase